MMTTPEPPWLTNTVIAISTETPEADRVDRIHASTRITSCHLSHCTFHRHLHPEDPDWSACTLYSLPNACMALCPMGCRCQELGITTPINGVCDGEPDTDVADAADVDAADADADAADDDVSTAYGSITSTITGSRVSMETLCARTKR